MTSSSSSRPSALLLWLLIACGSAAPAAAQTIQPGSLQTLRLADSLARYGQQVGDPWALVVAARLYRASGTSPSPGTTISDPAVAQRRPTEAALIGQARLLAQDRPDFLTALSRELESQPKTAMIGPRVERTLVDAQNRWQMALRFMGGTLATFGIAADPLDDLVLAVRGSDGKPVCEPELRSGELVCRWQPSEAADVRVEVVNRGRATRDVVFFHN